MPHFSTNRAAGAVTLRQEFALTARLGGPLAVAELGWMATYIVDAVLVGHMARPALALSALSLGNTIYYALVFCAIRFLTGLETLTAQAYGRGDQAGRDECTHLFAQSLWFVLLGTPLVMVATMESVRLLPHFGISAELVAETQRYLRVLVWSTAPLLLYMALRRYLQSVCRVWMVTLSLLSAVLVNWGADYALIFGHWGAPAMGIAGSAAATCVVRVVMLAILVPAFVLATRALQARFRFALLRPSWMRLRRLARIGWPDALENVTDLGFSTYMSIVCARLGTTLLAAHQIVLDLDAFVYMVPLGLSYATIVRTGQSAGGGSLRAVRRSANVSFVLGMGYIVIASLLFAGLPRTWAHLYTADPAVIAAAIPIFVLCGFLQLGDAANVLWSSALYGLGDTRTVFVTNTCITWLVGAPLSYYLAFYTPLSLTGLWLGRGAAAIVSGLAMVAVWHWRLDQLQAPVVNKQSTLTLLRPLSTE